MEFAVVINYRRGLGRSFQVTVLFKCAKSFEIENECAKFFIENKVLLWEYHAKATIPFK